MSKHAAQTVIFFGKGGEIATNRREDQELSVLALHLLQNCLVYVNTRMLQRVLDAPSTATKIWASRISPVSRSTTIPIFPRHNRRTASPQVYGSAAG
ncbi:MULTISPECIES: Tn3 family transposase [unclassified Sphingobium]|uniref:Tn3 family transposase n=1 Tax=unclassified Sphingobium TaxID=2611147 RepID=UPI0039658BE6